MSRSLQASSAGINKAKRALKRRNLTQKAIAVELAIASWATVNKFFNGKPILRLTFIEICEILELNWQDIAAVPLLEEDEEENISDASAVQLMAFAISTAEELPTAVSRRASSARTALDPYILQRIPRPALLEKCLQAINRGIKEQKRRVIPIIGAAGYGKSTILGNIYDELSQAGTGWIALIRCNDLIESIDTFAIELGEKASGSREPIGAIAQRLSATNGRGVLLIDTLDLVLTKPLIPVLRGIYGELLEAGTTIVFTCRDSDYRDFFEPYHESFAGFAESVECCEVPEFNEAEVKAAAQAFVSSELGINLSEDSANFANKIVTLSADSKSLQDIIRNPLLLALMCKLFAADGNVPEDLTVSQLYAIYWDLKIAQGRKNRPDSRRIGMAKRNLCLELAAIMYKKSGDRLRDFVYESNFDLTETQFLAYEELVSDGVLKELGGERIGFFHQTFLEYAIARWLDATESGEPAKNQLLNALKQGDLDSNRHYIWPTIRQLLNIVNLAEFHQIFASLNKQEILPFRAISFASVARVELSASSVLLEMLPAALALGDAYQEILLSVAKSAPNRHQQNVWLVVLELLEKTGLSLINKAAEIAGEMLSRVEANRGERINQALSAIANRAKFNFSEDNTTLFGKLISAYSQTPKTFGSNLDLEVLNHLKAHYFDFGSHTRSLVLQLYLTPGVPKAIQQELLLEIIAKPTSEQFKEKDKATELLKNLLPDLISRGQSPFGKTWLEALQAQLAKGWTLIQAAVVGDRAVQSPELISLLLQELLRLDLASGDEIILRRYKIAIDEAIARGGANQAAAALLNISVAQIPANRITTIAALLRDLAVIKDENLQIAPLLQESLVKWSLPILDRYPIELIPAISLLAGGNSSARQLVEDVLTQLINKLPPQQINQILKKLSYIPPQFESYLKANIKQKESKLALVSLYKSKIESSGSQPAIEELIKFCLDDSRDVALAASRAIFSLAENRHSLPVANFIPVLSQSKTLGVLNNCLKAIIEIVKAGLPVAESEIVHACLSLARYRAPEIVQPGYKLIECWVQRNNSISLDLAAIAFDLTSKLTETQQLDGGIAQAAFITLKNIANLENPNLIAQLAECTRRLLRVTDINRSINNLFVIGLLDRLGKFNHEFLAQIVRQDFIRDDGSLPLANMGVVVVAIARSQGKNSPLLDEILNDTRFPQEIKSRVIREREG